MNFMFEWQEQYLTIERSERVKYCSCHEQCSFYCIKHTDDDIFDDFPKISDHFPKISEDFQNCSEDQTNVPEHFPRISENFRRCPKISEDCRRLSRKTRRCFDDTPMNLCTI